MLSVTDPGVPSWSAVSGHFLTIHSTGSVCVCVRVCRVRVCYSHQAVCVRFVVCVCVCVCVRSSSHHTRLPLEVPLTGSSLLGMRVTASYLAGALVE